MMKKKDFDCVEMQDRAALRIYETTKDMTRDEELAYWRESGADAQNKYPRMRVAKNVQRLSR